MNKTKEIFERIYNEKDDVWTRSKPDSNLVKLVKNQKIKPCRTLEIGCGEGTDAIYLASKGFNVLGTDISEKAIKYAEEKAVRKKVKVRFIAMDISDLKNLKEKFDFVLEFGVMHHIMPPQRQKYVKDISRLLNYGGKYLSVCFNEQSPEFGGAGKKYRESHLGTKLYYSSQDELRKLFCPYFDVIEYRLVQMKGGHKGISHIGNYFFMEKK